MGIFDASSLPSGPTSQSTSTSSIQPWAQPYISNYLNQAQSLANQGPSALQNQSYTGAANLSMPGAFGAAEGLATQAGQGQLASAPIAYGYGTQGSQYGQQGANLGIAGGSLYGGLGANYGMAAGQNYANQATSPAAMQAYMNPYVQQSLAPQLGLLNQQQQLDAQNINAKAVGQGAFGGNRATLAQGLNSQNYDLAKQSAIAQGYNTAYQQAQQAQQFGANLGLQGALGGAGVGLQGVGTQLAGTGQGMQGAQVGLQGVSGAQNGYNGATNAANALTNLGTAQTNAQLGILGLQNQFGTQQYQQPFQNVQFQQGVMSNLPFSSQTTQGYQAPPNALAQVAGFGTTAIGAYGLANKAGLIGGGNNNNNTNPAAGSISGYSGVTGAAPIDAYNGGTQAQIDAQNQNYGYVAPQIQGEILQAKGGQIKERRYASGGAISKPTDLAAIRLNQLLGSAR